MMTIVFKGAIRDFYKYSSLRHELSPILTLTRPRRNHVQITCNTSCAYHVQGATWYEGTVQLLCLTKFTSHSFIFVLLAEPFTNEGREEIGVTLRKVTLSMSFRKCRILKPEYSSLNRDSNPHSCPQNRNSSGNRGRISLMGAAVAVVVVAVAAVADSSSKSSSSVVKRKEAAAGEVVAATAAVVAEVVVETVVAGDSFCLLCFVFLLFFFFFFFLFPFFFGGGGVGVLRVLLLLLLLLLVG